MSLFNLTKPAEITGTQALRQAVTTRNKQRDLARLSSECRVSILALENFINGADLNTEIKRALAKELFVTADFDPVIDRLVTPKNEPQAVSTIGELRFDVNDPRNKAVMPRPESIWAKGVRGYTAVDPPKVKPSGMAPKRPGFV